MSKDGPPSSGGYRHGKEAIYSGLPGAAVSPTGKLSEADAERRQNLSKFADYPGRVKSFGEQIPITERMREHSAKAVRLAEEEKRCPEDLDFVVVEDGLRLYKKRDHRGWHWYFVKQDIANGLKRKSKRYWERSSAKWAYENNHIVWQGYI